MTARHSLPTPTLPREGEGRQELPDTFLPYAEATQPFVPIEGYPNTVRRNPSRAPFARPYTRTELTGPMDLSAAMRPGDDNLAVAGPGRVALGQLIRVSGRVLDEDARPVAGAIVELWQANAAGRYAHVIDQRDAPLDPNFLGNGRTRTDANGEYAFLTVKPGAYPVPDSGRWWRPPHIHFSVIGPLAAGDADVFPGRSAERDRPAVAVGAGCGGTGAAGGARGAAGGGGGGVAGLRA